ncbi:MAG: amidohydrolase family protein [Actinomycetota bacterium]
MATTVFSNARVFDGTAFLDRRADVVVVEDVVTDIEPHGGVGWEEGADVVDCTDRTLLPGLIDAHVHVLFSNAGGLDMFNQPFSRQFYLSVRNLRATLETGITTVRDAGGADLGTKWAIAEGLVIGPRMKISVNVMGQTGGHADTWMPSGAHMPFMEPHPGRPDGIADGPEEARKVARLMFRAGADQVKICTSGGVLSPMDDPAHTQFTVAEIRAVVEEAEAHGSYVLAHAQGTEGIKNALRAGVRSIEHGIFLDEEAIGMMLEAEAYLVPTLVAPLSVVRNAERGVAAIPAQVVDKAKRVVDAHRESVQHAFEAGVRIAMGTDSGVGEHGDNLEELTHYAALGMDLEQVLASTTSVAADLVAPEWRVGRVQEGWTADLVVLDTELTSVEQLVTLREHIADVYLGGRRVAGA